MSNCWLVQQMELPKSCLLGNTIFKKLFYENTDLANRDKKLFADPPVEKLLWQASLKPATINIPAYKDEQREFEEIQIIEVRLRHEKQVRRIAEIVMRAIPYPMVVQLTHAERVMLVVGEPRRNLSDRSRHTIDEFMATGWIDTDNPSTMDETFAHNIHIRKLSSANLYRCYHSLVDQVILHNAAQSTGSYPASKDVETVKVIHDQIKVIEQEIFNLRVTLNKETQYNRKVDLNVQVKRLETKKNEITSKLGVCPNDKN
jgi:hypothetical protein